MGENVWWPRYCGNNSLYDAFWSPDLTLNTNKPDFTACFQYTVLTWIPVIIFWLALPVHIFMLKRKTANHTVCQYSRLNAFKSILSSALVITSFLELIFAASYHGPDTSAALITACVLNLITLFLVLLVTRYEYVHGEHSSSLLFIFWLIKLPCDIFIFRSQFVREYGKDDSVNSSYYACKDISFALLCAQFIMSLFSDRQAQQSPHQFTSSTDEKRPLLGGPSKVSESSDQPQKKPMPELSTASWLKLTFWWQTPDIVRGYKKPVVFDDLYDLRPSDTCQKTLPTFNNAYFENEDTEETIYTLKSNEFPKRSLLSATLLSVWGLMAGGSIFRVASIIMTLVNPQLLRIMIAYVDRDDPYTWKGIAICAILMVSIFANSIFTHTFMHTCMVAGLRARTIVNAVVYRKALKLSSEAKRETTVGQIVNLMSVDAQKIQDAFQFWHLIWSVPLLVGFAMYFLWQTIGVSCLAGLAVLIILVPVNGLFLANRVRKLQMLQMKEKDSRLKIMNEVLAGMKVLKLYAWEPSFEKDILECREKELQGIKKINYYNALGAMTWLLTPYLISLAIFSTYTSLSPDNILDPDKAFVSLSLINMLAFPLAMLPQGVSICAQAFVSMKRIEKFMMLGELQDDAVIQDRTMIESAIEIQDGTFSWGVTDKPTLKNINMTVKRGQLVAIVGLVGAGKSSLVGTVVGELLKTRGTVRVNGSMAYVPQQAWIQNATLRDNITFGKPFDQKKYDKCIDDCALTADLKNLPGGDQTEIGEKGINVSGGQKQRVSLARAVYQDESIYILDDPLSAVDAHVGKHIFENVIGPKGCLQGKTRVLVTHGLTYLSQVDHIYVLHQGKIFEAGTYNDLIEKDGAFAHYIRTYLTEEDLSETESDAEEISELRAKMNPLSGESGSEEKPVKPVERRGSAIGRRSSATSGLIRRRPSRAMSVELDIRPLKKQQHKPPPKKLIEEEVAEVGSVKPRVLKAYISAGSWLMFWIMIIAHILVMCTQAFTNIWLTIWTDHLPVNGTYEDGELEFYLGIYGGTGGLQAIIALIEAMCVAHGCWRASMIFHNDLLTRILRAPMSFFDTTPLGRVMNRFSKDIDILDANMPLFIRAWLFVLGPAIMTIFLIAYSTPIFLAVVIPIIIIYIASQRFYIATVRQLKRIDNVRRSPIYTHFDESIVGATSIRAYNKSEHFVLKCDNLIDESQKPWYLLCVANRWCGVTMEFLGSLIVFFAALFAVLGRGESVSASTAGLSVTYALQITSFLTSLIRTASDLETYVVSVERVDEYINAPNEAPWEEPNNKPARTWPAHGAMSFKQYSTRYREGLDLVLHDIECDIKSGEKIGVVGRTGAGKSSLSLALFRIIEAAHGQISIDGETIEDMGLHDLRSKIGIIPQDPVIFSGTIRHNLDPFDIYSDHEIWSALELAHLKRFVTNNADKLDYQCGEGGEALSVGQRQLLCLARALLKKSKILVLDEATAAVDMETDALIQETIKQEFDNNTILTVAHRLNTVMDYDRIMVLDKGEMKQFDSPENLLKDTKGIFYGMAKDAKLV